MDKKHNAYEQSLSLWYAQTSLLTFMRKQYQQFCHSHVSRLFGYYAIQVGGPLAQAWLAFSPIKQQIVVQAQLHSHDHLHYLCADYRRLPMKKDSVDLLILPHTLESLTDNGLVLAETWRILIPEGYVLLTGFNACRFRSLKKFIFKNTCKTLRRRDLQKFNTVKSNLIRHNFEIICAHSCLYFPRYLDRIPYKFHHLLERLAQIFWPNRGAVYLILAKKRVTTLTPVNLSWKQQSFLIKDSLTEPSTRGVNIER